LYKCKQQNRQSMFVTQKEITKAWPFSISNWRLDSLVKICWKQSYVYLKFPQMNRWIRLLWRGQIFVYYNRIIGILVPIPSRSESPQNQNLRGDIFVLCCHGPCKSGVHAGPSKFSFPKMPCRYCGVSLILYLTPRRSHNVKLMAQHGLLRKLESIGMFFNILVFASSARKNIWKSVLACDCFNTL